MCGHAWSCMVMCGYVRSCMIMWGHVRSFGQVWSFMVIYGQVWSFVVQYIYVWSCMIIKGVSDAFFPNLKSSFSIGEILLSVDTTKHHLYTGKIGKRIASLIWDIFQVYILKCRQNETTPISTTAIFEIKTQINRILKILPKSKLSLMYNASQNLKQTLS